MIRSLICAVALLLTVGSVAHADDDPPPLPAPTETPLLTVRGDLAVTNVGDEAVFDTPMLRDLGTVTYETETVWTSGLQTFTGVPLHAIAERVGTDAVSLKAIAINDYVIEIPDEDWGEGRAILAFERNGKPMSVREMGPLWIVYPYDLSPEMQTESIFARSVWQLAAIDFGS
nr:oxidoreductase [Palleronia pontilimi]